MLNPADTLFIGQKKGETHDCTSDDCKAENQPFPPLMAVELVLLTQRPILRRFLRACRALVNAETGTCHLRAALLALSPGARSAFFEDKTDDGRRAKRFYCQQFVNRSHTHAEKGARVAHTPLPHGTSNFYAEPLLHFFFAAVG
jgi:hypothetical protein